MTIENSNRYLRAFYPILIIALGMAALSRASFTPAEFAHPTLHFSNGPGRSSLVASIANSCSIDRFTSPNSVECRTEDGDSWRQRSSRESVTDFNHIKSKN